MHVSQQDIYQAFFDTYICRVYQRSTNPARLKYRSKRLHGLRDPETPRLQACSNETAMVTEAEAAVSKERSVVGSTAGVAIWAEA